MTYCENMDKIYDLSTTVVRSRGFVNWNEISTFPMEESTIEKFADQVDWYQVCINSTLSESFIETMIDYVDLEMISLHQKLGLAFIKKYIRLLRLDFLAEFQVLDDAIINEIFDGLDEATKALIGQYQNISDELIETLDDEILWDTVTINKKLSESFIKKNLHKLDKSLVLMYQTLSEEFLKEHKKYFHFNNISMYQKLSEEFIEEYKDELNWYGIIQNQSLSTTFLIKHEKHIDTLYRGWFIVYKCQDLPACFIDKYKNKFSLCM